MSLKNDLIKFRKRIIEKNKSILDEEEDSFIVETNKSMLDEKVDYFIDWYYDNMVKGYYTMIGEYREPIELRNFIEKVAVWYELRYPDYEINRIMPGSGQELTDINRVMFKNNPYINDLLDEDAETRELDWNDFYNTEVFIRSLPWEERKYLKKPEYPTIVYLSLGYSSAHLHLDEDGFVELSEYVSAYTKSKINDEKLKGLHIKEVLELLNEKGINLPKNSELRSTIKWMTIKTYIRDELLNCVMYRIIERGGNRFGPRRAFLFAKEFNRDISTPMIYGIDLSDPGLREFINEYIKNGGSKDLECYINYFSNIDGKLNKRTIEDLLLNKVYYSLTSFYTPEENELHQRLVNSIANQANQKILKKQR